MSDYLKFISPTDLVLPAVHYSLVFGATNAASQKNIFGYSCHIALKDIQGLGMANTSRQFRGDVAFSDDVIANAEPLPLYVNKSTIKHGDDPHMSSVTRDFKLSLGRKFQPSPNLRNWQAKAKRFCDIAFSASALAGLSPLLAIISLAIVLESRGSVFFLQEREGKDGELFTAIKFRSMRRDDADISGI